MNRSKFAFLLLVILFTGNGILHGEGTKQILLSDAGHGKLSIMPTFSEFAWYTAAGVSGNVDYRLNIRVKQLGEVIYYGLGDPLNNGGTIVTDVVYRIKDPTGAIVVGPTPVPLSGAGYIATFNQAINGPSAIIGASGYPELTYTPLMTGDYFIEFNFNTGGHDRTKFRYFDITVADAANNPINGRVWSKAWQCTADANGLQYDFYGTFYIYSQDSIVTSVYGNGMAPYVFTIACNQYGCFNTGNFINDRRSVPGNHIIPQYLVFLNNPDSTIWPTGIIGQIVPPIVVTPDCNTGAATIDITVTKAGTVDLVLNINPLPGIQPQDRVITTAVNYGVNTINWDGLNGLGVPVPNGAIFDINITYINGLTNLPIYDIDDNPNGYIINLHRPSGPLPKVYWDDNLIGGGQNLTGCIYTLPITGCHPVLIAIGNNNTINTWWNAATHVAAPITYVEHRAAIVAGSFGPVTVCANTTGIRYYCTPTPNATNYLWTYSGSGVTINGDGNNNDTVYLDFGPTATAGTLTVAGYNPECGAGPGRNIPITISPIPDLTTSPLSHSQCSNIGTGILLTSTNPGTTFTWTCTASSPNITGYSPNPTGAIQINQTLVNSGSNVETVTYHITPHLGVCTGIENDYTVTVFPVPHVSNSPLAKSQCNNMSTGINLTSTVAGSTFTWTCIPSSLNITGYSSNFIPATSINQTLVNIAYNIETVVYRIIPTANGCSGPFTDYTVTIYPTPNLSNIPLSKAQCNNTATGISLTSNVTGTLFTWTCVPSSPSVTGWANNATPTTTLNQTLVNSGYNIETVTYQMIPRANGCNGPVTNYVVTVYPVPDLSNSPASKSICSNTSTGVTLTSNVAGTAFTWTCIPSSGNVTGWSNNAIPTTSLNQTLVNTGTGYETVTYRLTPIANGCNGPVRNYVVTVSPVAIITTNPLNKSICNNSSTNISPTANLPGTLYTWTCTPSSGNVTGWANNAIPASSINQFLVNSGSGIENVIYTITPVYNGCPGNLINYTVTVYPTPNLTNNPLSKIQCSNTPTGIILTSNVAGTLFTWTCVPSSGNITGWANNAVPASMLNQTLFNVGNGIETVTYQITPNLNGCAGPMTNYVVSVYPVPMLTTTPLSKSFCTFNLTNILLTSNVPGTLFTWNCTPSSGNITGYSNSASPGVFINQTLSNTGFTDETVTYHITPTANGCNGPVTNYIVTVHPMPNLSNNPALQSQCNNTNTNITLTSNVAGTQFTWICFPSSGTLSGFANSTVPAATINQVLVNSDVSVESVTYQLTPAANGCAGPVSDYVVTVFPTPHLTIVPSSKSQCNNANTNILLSSDVTGTMFTWTCTPSSANIIGFSSNAVPAPSINQLLVNTGFNTETVVYHVTPWANGCPGPVADYTVTVYPTPDLSNTPLSKSQCNNTGINVTLTSHVTSTLFTWICTPSSGNITGWSNNATPTTVLNQVLVSTSNMNETVTYHITPSINGCNGPVTDYVVTVYPAPVLSNNPLSQSQCNNLNTGITLISNVGGALFSWTCTPSSANITGWANNSIPAGAILQTLVNSGFNTEWVTYHVTPMANGCSGSVYDYIVTVYPTPNVSNSPLSKSQCNTTNTNVTLTSNVAGATFTWICTPSGPGITGWANNPVPATTINQVLVNSTFTPQTVTYRITPSANGCPGPLMNYIVTVYPTPNLTTTPLNKQQCNNQATNITLTSSVSGVIFSWTCTPSSSNVTGFSPGSGTLINHTLINSGSVNEMVTYHITPIINGCSGSTEDYVVTVYPTPVLTLNPASQSQCNNTTTNISLTSNVAGALFTWTCVASSGNVTGYSSSAVPGTLINQTLVNSGSNTEWVTYHITPTANLCSGPVADYTVTVYPSPVLFNSPSSQTQCNNVNTNITLNSNVPGTLFTWTCTPSSATVTGYSNSTIPSNTIQQVLLNSGLTMETITYNLIPQANGCSGNPAAYVVTVSPEVLVFFTPPAPVMCGGTTTNITNGSNIPGASYSWSATGSSQYVTGYGPGSGNLISQTILNTGFSIESVTYTVTPVANGCPGVPLSVSVTVLPQPFTTFTICNDPVTTVNSRPVTLRGGVPLGGTYSGPGVAGNIFSPSAAGPGNHIITYSVTNSMGCSKTATQTLSVLAATPFACGNTLTDVRDNAQYTTVQIGAQCWMAENLNYGTRINSTIAQRDNCVVEKYCFSNVPANCITQGGFYQWDELMHYAAVDGDQGICPPGWHVPAETEWTVMFNSFGPRNNAIAAANLKSTGASGYDASMYGFSGFNKSWNHGNFATMFWSSTSHGPFKAWAHGMNTPDDGVSTYPGFRANAFSIRCIQD
jgi:uncharacterized protein (TIGR02145 family)